MIFRGNSINQNNLFMRVYLDNAATTPLDREVIQTMLPLMEKHYGNPSSIHFHGRETRAAIEKARKSIAQLLNTSPAEIFFTSGGTEADNFAINCSIESFDLKHAITSPLEHHAVLHTLEHLAHQGRIKLSLVQVDEKGNLDRDCLEELLKSHPRSLVSLMHANNEIGTLYDIEQIGHLCKKYNAIYHCDTVQTMGHFRHDLPKLPVDFIVGAAHKFHGPKGTGFIYISNKTKICPMIYGGAQERNMRGGTENLYGIIGMAKALEMAYAQMEEHRRYIEDLKLYMIGQLQQHIEGVQFNGESANLDKSLYTVLNVCFPSNENSDMLLFNLDIQGISVSGGSACSSGSNVGSHVLSAIKASEHCASVRFSFSRFNQKEEIDYVVGKLLELFPQKVKV